jgi:hypothetical protein
MRLDYFINRCYSEGRSKAILARRVGTGDATSAERSYLKTLITGARAQVALAFRNRSWEPLARMLVMGLGLFVTGSGFAVGSIAAIMGAR